MKKESNNKKVKDIKKETNSKKVKEVEKEEVVKNIKIEKEKQHKSIGRIIFDVVFWVGITVLAIIWFVDFIKVQKSDEPVFCLVQKTHEFEDGTVEECIGLGYKIYEYNRESISNARQFSPFFVGMKK